MLVRSAARDRNVYLRRPDLGRVLSDESQMELQRGEFDAAIVMADGLSAPAVHRRAAPLTVVLRGRVAVGDEIGERLGARLVVMLIGERPGLTAPDSLGIYLTYDPRVGRTEAERNFISNVAAGGPVLWVGGAELHYLMKEARVRKLTGVGLKEDANAAILFPP